MKKLFVFICIIQVLFLTSCNNKYNHVTNETQYDLYETRIMDVGEKEKLNVDYFNVNFNRVEFYSSDERVARINYKEELVTLRTGRTRITATLYNHDDMVTNIDFGYVYVLDINDPDFIPIRDQLDLRTLMTNNPSGFYYIAADIDISNFYWVEPIPYFEGILINPYDYVITGLTITSNKDSALIQETRNAYIDGIILEDVKITGKENSNYTDSIYTGALVGSATDSYISNIKVTGEVKQGIYVGGIAGSIQNTSLINSSFEGIVSHGDYVGGLVGQLKSFSLSEDIRGRIINSYAIADLSGGYSLENSRIGGLAGEISGGLIKSSFYTGTINFKESELASPIGVINHSRYTLEDVYYTFYMPEENVFNEYFCNVISVHYINEEDLKSGKPLKGLEEFQFEVGRYPTNK